MLKKISLICGLALLVVAFIAARAVEDSYEPRCAISFAIAIDEEGQFDALPAWREAERQWDEFGKRSYPVGEEPPIPIAGPLKNQSHRILKDILNYEFWKEVCQMEQSDHVLVGRRVLSEAVQRLDAGNDAAAGALFARGFKSWGMALQKYKQVMYDDRIRDYLEPLLKRYRIEVLKADDFPDDFALKPAINYWKRSDSD